MDLGAELENALFTESNLTELCSSGLSAVQEFKSFSLYLCWSLGQFTFSSAGAKCWKASATKMQKCEQELYELLITIKQMWICECESSQ